MSASAGFKKQTIPKLYIYSCLTNVLRLLESRILTINKPKWSYGYSSWVLIFTAKQRVIQFTGNRFSKSRTSNRITQFTLFEQIMYELQGVYCQLLL